MTWGLDTWSSGPTVTLSHLPTDCAVPYSDLCTLLSPYHRPDLDLVSPFGSISASQTPTKWASNASSALLHGHIAATLNSAGLLLTVLSICVELHGENNSSVPLGYPLQYGKFTSVLTPALRLQLTTVHLTNRGRSNWSHLAKIIHTLDHSAKVFC